MAVTARPWITAGIALVGAGAIAVTPVTAPLPGVIATAIQLASTETDMILDLVRHGQSEDNVAGIIGTLPPGAPLTSTGATQAAYLADSANPLHLGSPSSYDGVYSSEFLRTQQTAADWLTAAGAPSTTVDHLSGLNEVNAGILDGATQTQTNGLMYLAAPLAWMFGQWWVPQLGSDIDVNGVAFNDRFSDAVDTIYGAGDANGDGSISDVAFAHALSIVTWTMMNVKNPDFGLLFSSLTSGLLPNTGQVVVEGNPTDGWTLVSWNGTAVDADPGLLTNLFVDFRDLGIAPQIASYHIQEAIESAFSSNDWAAVWTAMQDGFEQVGNALMQFPVNVWDDLLGAFSTPDLAALF